MKRVILTGATGFVGANLARRLLHDGHEIHLLVRPGYTRWRIEVIRSDVCLHEVDLGDAQTLVRVVDNIRPDWVFHLAAYGGHSSQADLRQMVQTNITGTINLVETCLDSGFEAFVNTGSSSEYGLKNHPPSEKEWLEPNSHYALTKAYATLFCRYTSLSQKCCLPTLRLYSVYGPYEEPTRLMPTLVLRGLKGELPPLVKPDAAHDFIYIEDVVEAYLLAATRPKQELGRIYNVGTGVQTSLREVVDIARQVMGLSVEPKWSTMSSRQWDSSIWVADNRKIRGELGWQPRHTFERGFQLLTNWFRENPPIQILYEELRCKSI